MNLLNSDLHNFFSFSQSESHFRPLMSRNWLVTDADIFKIFNYRELVLLVSFGKDLYPLRQNFSAMGV